MPIRLAAHHSVDGIVSAVLFAKVYDDVKVVFPEYGETKDKDGRPYDFMISMVPNDPKWEGMCFDNHSHHSRKRKYRLILSVTPVSVEIYQRYKEILPDGEEWKVAIGCSGEGKIEALPGEIMVKYPQLTSKVVHVFHNKTMTVPVYSACSSIINAYTKVCEEYSAYELLSKATSPEIILNDKAGQKHKETIKYAKEAILQSFGNTEDLPIDIGPCRYAEFESPYRLGSIISSELMDGERTVVVYNRQRMKGYIRGKYANAVIYVLNLHGIKAQGGNGFGSFESDKGGEVIIECLTKLRSLG
ncbi:MAG: hypothetical protein ACTSUO_06070 [Candidatus Thorarchaeota archaeon]